jgi:hypothetical protein
MSNKTALKRLRKKKTEATKAGKKAANKSGSGGLLKKIRRKAYVGAKKQFMRDFKERMESFKRQVKCTVCDRQPNEGENIDNWHINKQSENIDLICTNCYTEEESEDLNESNAEDVII